MKGEFDFIAGLRAKLQKTRANLIAGIGDDAAILRPPPNRELLFTTDLLVEDIHFTLDSISPFQLGHKSLAVNLSDIAAMGGRPGYFLLSFARPRSLADSFLEEMMDGMLSLAGEHDVLLIGGDTSAAREKLFINVTVIGDCEIGKAICRNTARPGDQIYVTGRLGGSAFGLELLRSGMRLDEKQRGQGEEAVALRAHLLPQPRVAFGAAIGERGLATAMIDISDGLSSDLGHICDESGVGAEIEALAIPVAAGASLEQALDGGEDYELLFSVSPERATQIEQLRTEFPDIDISLIGSITASKERRLIREGKKERLKQGGYDHFSQP